MDRVVVETRVGASRNRVRVWAVAGLLLACATPQDTFWSKGGAGEDQFRSASRRCNRSALENMGPPSRSECGYSTGAGGTICRRTNPDDAFEAEQIKRRRERRLAYLYGQCLEDLGWTANSEGSGFKGRY